jgi:M6 family metalloprotease-like protein
VRVRLVSLMIAAVTVAALVVPLTAAALEPPRAGELQRYTLDGTLSARQGFARRLGNDKVAPRLVRSLSARLQAVSLGLDGPRPQPPLGWRGMPTTGTNNVLVLCIDFSDYPAGTAVSTVQSKVFGSGVAGEYPYESLTNYYSRSSYGKLAIQGSVLGWYRAGYTRASVSQTDSGREKLIKEALQYYDATTDYSQFDNNHDGRIDYFAVLWTGPDNGWANFWWGYQTSWWATAAPVLDGVTPDTYSWQWELRWSGGVPTGTFTPRVMIHETGHALGLPDYYDYDPNVGPDGGIGGYDMMDANTGDHNAFSKWLLDWIAPSAVSWVTRTQTLTPSCSNATGSALAVMPGLAAGNWNNEFFLIQDRYKVTNSNDRGMPGTHGLQIWHVDARLNAGGSDYLYDNSYTAHKLLRLQEADGLEEIEQSKYMNAGDYYVAGGQFLTTGTPSSQTYAGGASGVVVDTIGELNGDVTFRVVGGYDHVAPVTTADRPGGVWHHSAVDVTFSPVDTGGSGLAYTEYNVDGTGWITGTKASIAAPTNHANDGLHTVQFRSADKAENLEPAQQVQVGIDTQAPVTSVIGADPFWHGADVTLVFSSTDAGGSGLARTEYDVDGGGWTTGASLLYTAPPDHSHDGAHVVSYRGVDGAGNVESAPSCDLKIDTAGPTTSDDSGGVWHRTPYTVTITADDPLSGVGVIYSAVGDTQPRARSQLTFRTRRHRVRSGAYELFYFALDKVDNDGPSHHVQVLIDDEKPVTSTNFVSGQIVFGSFTLVLTAEDRHSGVDTSDIHYRIRLDGGAWGNWTTGHGGTIPAPPSGEYAGDIQFYSIDRAGNVEPTQTASLTIRPALSVPGIYHPSL